MGYEYLIKLILIRYFINVKNECKEKFVLYYILISTTTVIMARVFILDYFFHTFLYFCFIGNNIRKKRLVTEEDNTPKYFNNVFSFEYLIKCLKKRDESLPFDYL